MKKSVIALLFLMGIGTINAQAIEKGDLLILGEPSGARYHHIDFPRKNIIIKRGGIANFKNIMGEEVIVENIMQQKNGSERVTLRRKDGFKFFRFYRTVTADLEKALEKSELRRKL